MFKISRKIFLLIAGLVLLLTGLIPLPAYSADKLLVTLNLVEYTYPTGRLGTINVYQTVNKSPLSTYTPALKVYDTGLTVTTTVGSVGGCNGSFLAGGVQKGWLLGPDTDITTITSLDPSANVLYAVTTKVFTGDNGTAFRYDCNGASISEAYTILYVFLLANPYYVSGQGTYIGDAWYISDISPNGNWYYVYQP